MKPLFYKKILLAILATIFGSIALFNILGYSYADSMYDADRVAEKLVAKNRSAQDCLKIKTFFPTYPPVSEFRSSCIHEYAKITKDPKACELILPSGYGLSCVGMASKYEPVCNLNRDMSVSGNGIYLSLQQCLSTPENVINDCCITAKANFITEFNDCSAVKDTAIRGECLFSLAFKNKDPSYCANIQNNDLKIDCTLRATALQQDPSICTGCVDAVSIKSFQ